MSAFAVNALLFLFAYLMVTKTPQFVSDPGNLNLINFIRLEQPPEKVESRTEQIKPEEPPPPEPIPSTPKLVARTPPPEPVKMDLPAPDIRLSPSLKGVPYTGDFLKSPPVQPATVATEGAHLPDIITDITPLVRIEPQYPPRALRSGTEGAVTVEFIITVDGSVRDIKIISATPQKIFDNEVIKAVNRWKFKPQTEGGKPVEKRARQDIRFTLRK